MTPRTRPNEAPQMEAEEPRPEPAELADEEFPPYVETPAQKLRFRYAAGIALALFGDDGEDHVWMAARSLYNNPNFED
jgi:hypothetical protein